MPSAFRVIIWLISFTGTGYQNRRPQKFSKLWSIKINYEHAFKHIIRYSQIRFFSTPHLLWKIHEVYWFRTNIYPSNTERSGRKEYTRCLIFTTSSLAKLWQELQIHWRDEMQTSLSTERAPESDRSKQLQYSALAENCLLLAVRNSTL